MPRFWNLWLGILYLYSDFLELGDLSPAIAILKKTAKTKLSLGINVQ